MATLGTKLLNLRKEHRLSQAEIAEKLDVSQNAYNKWEADKCKPGAENLYKISVFYKIDLTELLDDSEKISVSINTIKGGNNIIAEIIPNASIPQSKELIDILLQNQEQISKLLERQFELVNEIMKK